MVAVLSVFMCLLLIGADQFIKHLVVEYLKPVEYIDVIDGVLRFRYVENTGAVFGSFATHTVFLTIFSIVLLVFTVYFLVTNKSKSKLVNFCLLLMISGGIGNIIDRVRLQYVVDYIEPVFVDFAVFNFADCLITVGAFILIIYLIYDLIRDIKKEKSGDTPPDEDDTEQVEGKSKRFIRKRRVKKAEVEGDKEAVVFNAVISGESPDDVLKEMKLGIDNSDDTPAVPDAVADDEFVDNASDDVIIPENNNSTASDEARDVILKADALISEADTVIEAARIIEADVGDLKKMAEAVKPDVVASSVTPESVTPADENIVEEDKSDTASKSKKISIDSIEDLDFSLFE